MIAPNYPHWMFTWMWTLTCSHSVWSMNDREGCSDMLPLSHNVIAQFAHKPILKQLHFFGRTERRKHLNFSSRFWAKLVLHENCFRKRVMILHRHSSFPIRNHNRSLATSWQVSECMELAIPPGTMSKCEKCSAPNTICSIGERQRTKATAFCREEWRDPSTWTSHRVSNQKQWALAERRKGEMYEWNTLPLLRTKERFCGGWGKLEESRKIVYRSCTESTSGQLWKKKREMYEWNSFPSLRTKKRFRGRSIRNIGRIPRDRTQSTVGQLRKGRTRDGSQAWQKLQQNLQQKNPNHRTHLTVTVVRFVQIYSWTTCGPCYFDIGSTAGLDSIHKMTIHSFPKI